ncbi:MAG: hypothetical protein AAFP90_24205, partial [Planctomycetota bacterium]
MPATVLYITPTLSAGYSPRGGGELTVAPPDSGDDLPLMIETLLAMMPGRHRQVYVLTTEVWSQSVTVDTRVIRRLASDQLPQMLAYEAEAFSSISAASSRTSVERLGDAITETTFRVSQIDASRFAGSADAIAFNGGKLMGIANPAALPISLTSAGSDWTRLERWDESAVMVSKPKRGPAVVQFLDGIDGAVDSPAAARDFLIQNGIDPQSTVELLAQSILPGAISDDYVFDLNDTTTLQSFLAAWSRFLKSPKHPSLIRPVRQRSSAKTKWLMGVATTAATIAGLVAFHI